MSDKTKIIAGLNDTFRQAAGTAKTLGRVSKTQGINALPVKDQVKILDLVRTFNDFNESNDPYGEHDFGSIAYEGQKVFWKIDYYDENGAQGSKDPSDPEITTRHLTVMLAHEW